MCRYIIWEMFGVYSPQPTGFSNQALKIQSSHAASPVNTSRPHQGPQQSHVASAVHARQRHAPLTRHLGGNVWEDRGRWQYENRCQDFVLMIFLIKYEMRI